MSAKKRSGKMGMRVAYYALLTFFSLVFIGSAIYVGTYVYNSRKSQGEYDDLREQLAHIRETIAAQPAQPTLPPAPPPTDPQTGETLPTEPKMLPDYAQIYALNSDLIGWITIPGTKVDYPVMQTPDRKDYYLKRNFNKMGSDWGAIYAREECDVFAPSDNVVLYGHHMKDGSMFAGLDSYKKESFWRDHQTFTFDTLYERHTYQIIAVFKTSASLNKGFAYHRFNDAANQQEFDEFVATVKKMSFYDTGLTATYGDKLLCLSTCEYSLENGRFVVVAKRIS